MGRWPLVDIGRQRERRESGQWNLSIGFELTSAFVNRGYAAWKNVADGGPFSFAKSGEENRAFERPFAIPPIRSRVQAGSSNSFALAPSLLRFPPPVKLSHFPNRRLIPSHFSSNLSIFLLVAHAVLSLKIYTYVKQANESSIHLSRINVADVEYLDTNFF